MCKYKIIKYCRVYFWLEKVSRKKQNAVSNAN